MDVYFDCFKCKTEQLAKGVTDEVPTPVGLMGTCEACGHKSCIWEQGRQKWLEDRGFEIKNTSHPKWHVKDVEKLDDLQYEFSLVYQGYHTLSSYAVGFYGAALHFYQQWVVDKGFDKAPRFILKLTVSYDHKENNTHHYAKGTVLGFYGTMEAVEKGIAERRAWRGDEWLTRDHFSVEEIDTR